MFIRVSNHTIEYLKLHKCNSKQSDLFYISYTQLLGLKTATVVVVVVRARLLHVLLVLV